MIISIGLDRPSRPRGRFFVAAGVILRDAGDTHPNISHRIARTEAQGLDNVSLGFFSATSQNLTKSNIRMGVDKVSIKRQGMFTLGDALRRALGEYLDKS